MPRRGCARLWHEDVDVRPRPSDDAAMGARNRGPSGWPGGRRTDAARLDLTASQALRVQRRRGACQTQRGMLGSGDTP